jgi:uncharacterized protein
MRTQRPKFRQGGTNVRPRTLSILVFGALFAAFCVLCVVSSCPARLSAQNPDQLKPQGYVNDFANVLSPSTREQIAALCAEVDQRAQAQIAVVTVKTTNGQSAFDYSLDLATHWGVGPKQKDRGVMIFVAVDDHKYFTQVGYGLEGILPDGKVGSFGREAVPYFRQSNYGAAILLMTRRVADVIAADRGITLANEPAASPPVNATEGSRSEASPSPVEVILILVAIVVIFRIVRATLFASNSRGYYGRRSSGWWMGPMMGGFGGGFGGGAGGGGFGGFGGGSFGGGGAGGSW